MSAKEGGSDAGQAGFASDLEKAWDESEAEDVAKVEDAPEGDKTGDRPRDDKGRFVAKDGAQEGDPDADKAEVDADDDDKAESHEAAAPLAPPEHWSQADKDAFNALPEEIKPLYLDKAKSLESGWNKKFEDVANERKSFEGFKAFKEIFDPFQQQLAMAGLTPEAYVRKLLAIGQSLEANPEQTLRMLAQQYRVDLGKPADGADMDQDADPVVTAFKTEIANLRQELQSIRTQQQQGVAQTYEQEWTGFQNAKDASGNPQFPSADKLKIRMGQELAVSPQQPGETIRQALERAYEAVKWTDPEIRKSILEAQAKKEEAERQRKADLEKAKKAGDKPIKGKTPPGDDKRAPGKSWKEDLEQLWDQAQA